MTTLPRGGSLFALLLTMVMAHADPKPDRELLVGTWKIVQYQDDGSDKIARLGVGPGKKGEPYCMAKLVFSGDECWVMRGDGRRDMQAGLTNTAWQSVTLDATKEPKQIDIVGRPNKDGKAVQYYGIYKLEGKKLTICWNETPKSNDPSKIRPTKFESDGDMNLFVCEKLAEAPEKPKE